MWSGDRELVSEEAPAAGVEGDCYHCGSPCGRAGVGRGDKLFCCSGCLTVHELLAESGLGHFYDLNEHPGIRVGEGHEPGRWDFLDDPAVLARLLDYGDGRTNRVTFQVPAIHCVACVWLLENLFQLKPGVGRSRVNFPRREVTIEYSTGAVRLSELAGLLASLGYEPRLTLGALDRPVRDPVRQRRMLQTGVAGFAFGNIMLFSVSAYLGFDSGTGVMLGKLFGYLSLVLALPVLVFSASDYWLTALRSFRQRVMTLDVPIALGLVALYGRSAWEILGGHGEGYLDSLTGLVFFLLCGRWYQDWTHARLVFDRDYRSFFPLSVVRRTDRGEEVVALSSVRVGDRLVVRHGELIPADARLVKGCGWVDYSFVTGESAPVGRGEGEVVYAGGQQAGGAIEVETVKPVSQGYLTSLWDHPVFGKREERDLNTLTHRYSRWFTSVVVGIAVLAGAGWWLAGDGGRGVNALVAVLIVACPCALALAAPFTLGTAQRWLVRAGVFLRNAQVLECLARVDAIVFDKTGTLTEGAGRARWCVGAALERSEAGWIRSLVRQSVHPLAQRLASALAPAEASEEVGGFEEIPGHGVAGRVAGREIWVGSKAWLADRGVRLPDAEAGGEREDGSAVYVALDGRWRGGFRLTGRVRPDADRLVERLGGRYELALLSGDNARERERFRRLFGEDARLRFHQSPHDKLEFIRDLQGLGRRVMMVGDGLNDAGALRQSDVGVAVVERVGAFSPASDVILAAEQVPRLADLLGLAGRVVKIVRFSFAISGLYNVVGVSIAAAGWLSPLLCAVLMPLSSVSVVLFACGATTRAVRRSGLRFDLEQGVGLGGRAS
jgi:P-type Cu+ transporter